MLRAQFSTDVIFNGNAIERNNEFPVRSSVSFSHNSLNNVFPRAFTPRLTVANSIGATGSKKYGSFSLQGDVQIQRTAELARPFASVFEPYSGSPFVWADTVGGDWTKSQILTNIQGQYRFSKMFALWLAVNYRVGTGNRINDPRPLYRNNALHTQTGFLFTPITEISPYVFIGISGAKEENEFGYYANSFSQLLRLSGYTLFESATVNSALRVLEQQWQYAGVGARFNVMGINGAISLAYIERRDTSYEGVSSPVSYGKYYERANAFRFILRREYDKWGVSTTITSNQKTGRGYDPNFKAINSQHEIVASTFSYEVSLKNVFKVSVGLNHLYSKQKELYTGYNFSENRLSFIGGLALDIGSGIFLFQPELGFEFPLRINATESSELILKYYTLIAEKEYGFAKRENALLTLGFGLDIKKSFVGFQSLGVKFVSINTLPRSGEKPRLLDLQFSFLFYY